MGYLEKAREHIKKTNLENEKLLLLDELFENLNENFPRGVYVIMEKHFLELEERFNQSEEKINSLIRNGTIVELKQSLEGFWYLHQELMTRINNSKLTKTKQNSNIDTPFPLIIE